MNDVEVLYPLTNGKYLSIEFETIGGMAGEPMDIPKFTIEEDDVTFDEVEPLMEAVVRAEVERILEAVGESNYANAVAWCE